MSIRFRGRQRLGLVHLSLAQLHNRDDQSDQIRDQQGAVPGCPGQRQEPGRGAQSVTLVSALGIRA